MSSSTLQSDSTRPACINKLMAHFETMNVDSVDGLDEIYHPNIHFQDPIHEIKGLGALTTYFSHLNKNLVSGHFDFKGVDRAGQRYFFEWVMTVKTKRPKKTIVLHGMTKVEIDGERIIRHRDYFDLGEMVYEHVPLLRGLVRAVKKRLAKQ